MDEDTYSGSNHPPSPIDTLDDIDPEKLIDVDRLPELLDRNYSALAERSAELVGGAKRWARQHTPIGEEVPVIDGEADAGDTGDFLNMLRGFAGPRGEADKARESVKRSLIDGGRVIDSHFTAYRNPVLDAMAPIQAAADAYVIAVEAAERAAWLKEQQEASERARALEESIRTDPKLTRDQIVAATAEMIESEIEADKGFDKPRVRGDLGAVMSQRELWSASLVDIKVLAQAVLDGKAPVTYLAANMQAIGADVRKKNGVRSIPGVKITKTEKAGTR